MIVSQMYSKQTTEVMNDKLKLRKDIIANNPTWKMFVFIYFFHGQYI